MDSRWSRLDSVHLKVGESAVPLRLAIITLAAVLWFATIALEAGATILPAAATALAFLVPLTAISLASRTVGFRLQLSFFLWGGLIIAAALLAIDLFEVIDRRNDTLRNDVVPLLEETLKLLPLLVFLVLRRRDRAWTVGAMDVLLLAATTGAAFGFVEDAYIRQASHWSEGFSWLPVTSLLDFKHRLVAGHAIWTGIAGGTIGLALLWRGRARLAVPLGVVGFLWSWLDHAANNQLAIGGRDGSSDVVVGVWRLIEGNGFFSVYLFLALLAIAVVADRWALRAAEPLTLPELPPSVGILDRWRWVRARRALTFAAWQLRGHRADAAPAPLVQLRTILSGATIGSLALLLLAVTGFAAAGALAVMRVLPPGPGFLGWLHDVGANIGDQGVPGGVAIGVGAGAVTLGTGTDGGDSTSDAPEPTDPPLTPQQRDERWQHIRETETKTFGPDARPPSGDDRVQTADKSYNAVDRYISG